MSETNETDDLTRADRDVVRLDGGGRELVVATGADRVRFLHGLVTGKIVGTPVGGACRAALLTTKGHMVSELRVFVRPDELWLLVDAGQAAPTATTLARYAIMDDFAAVPHPDFALLRLVGPDASTRLSEVGLPPGQLADAEAWAHADVAGPDGTCWLVRSRELGRSGFWVGGGRDAIASLGGRLAQLGVPSLTPAVAEAARIEALEPRWGREITPDYFPMEVGLSEAIDYSKGCYLGQEPIVRIRDRGHINWRLVGLDIVGPGDVAPGDRLETDAKAKAGRVTSAGRFPDGRGVALALLHVSVPVGCEVRIRGGEAAGMGAPGDGADTTPGTLRATVRAEVT